METRYVVCVIGMQLAILATTGCGYPHEKGEENFKKANDRFVALGKAQKEMKSDVEKVTIEVKEIQGKLNGESGIKINATESTIIYPSGVKSVIEMMPAEPKAKEPLSTAGDHAVVDGMKKVEDELAKLREQMKKDRDSHPAKGNGKREDHDDVPIPAPRDHIPLDAATFIRATETRIKEISMLQVDVSAAYDKVVKVPANYYTGFRRLPTSPDVIDAPGLWLFWRVLNVQRLELKRRQAKAEVALAQGRSTTVFVLPPVYTTDQPPHGARVIKREFEGQVLYLHDYPPTPEALPSPEEESKPVKATPPSGK